MNTIKRIAALALLSIVATATQSRTVEIQFNIQFTRAYDFATANWTNISQSATAFASFDVDATSPGVTSYWGTQIQSISTGFGAPTISSDFIQLLPFPENSAAWQIQQSSFSLATNIDYSISWPETPMGTGPFVNYQLNDAFTGQLNGQVWDYIVGFNLATPGFASPEIRPLSGEEILDYIYRSQSENRSFTTGFNSRVYDQSTYQNIYGSSFQGVATIAGVNIVSTVPEVPTSILLLSAVPLLAWAKRSARLRL